MGVVAVNPSRKSAIRIPPKDGFSSTTSVMSNEDLAMALAKFITRPAECRNRWLNPPCEQVAVGS
jgi:hypothetical protein